MYDRCKDGAVRIFNVISSELELIWFKMVVSCHIHLITRIIFRYCCNSSNIASITLDTGAVLVTFRKFEFDTTTLPSSIVSSNLRIFMMIIHYLYKVFTQMAVENREYQTPIKVCFLNAKANGAVRWGKSSRGNANTEQSIIEIKCLISK